MPDPQFPKGEGVFAQMIVRVRTEKGIPQTELAEACGVTRRTWLRWEAGTSLPLPQQMPGIAKALGLQVEVVMAAVAQDGIQPFLGDE